MQGSFGDLSGLLRGIIVLSDQAGFAMFPDETRISMHED
jgi:hypothetical protein